MNKLFLEKIKLGTAYRDKKFHSKDSQQVIEIYKEYYPQIGYIEPWIGYFICDESIVYGTCGFTGQPKNNTVEIAYWTFKKYEGKGIARFACKSLIKLVQAHDQNLGIIAKTAPSKNASTHILEKHGFVFSEVVQDEDIGDSWLWTLKHP